MLVERIVKMRAAEPHRPVFAFGIDGLKQGLALPVDPATPSVPNPKAGEVGEPDVLPWWAQLPHGSIICIDEVQDLWPTRGAAAKPPLDVALLNKHRHWGYDFLLTSQAPSYLDSHVRGLVQEHSHLVRKWGGLKVDRYVWQEGVSDVKSTSMRARAHKQKYRYPKECFDLYKSSTMHTVKSRKPWFVYALPGFFVLAALLGYYGFYRARHITDALKPPAAAASSFGFERSSQASADGSPGRRVVYATLADYVKAFTPRISDQPWSAPAYDADAFRSRPDLYCIEFVDESAAGQKICQCFTEQVTRYHLSVPECRRIAREGQYNPHRPQFASDDSRADRRDAREPSAKRSEATGDARSPVGPVSSRVGAHVGAAYDPSTFSPHATEALGSY